MNSLFILHSTFVLTVPSELKGKQPAASGPFAMLDKPQPPRAACICTFCAPSSQWETCMFCLRKWRWIPSEAPHRSWPHRCRSAGRPRTDRQEGCLQDNDRNKTAEEITHHGARDENFALVAVVLLLHFLSRDGLKSNLHHGDRLSVCLSVCRGLRCVQQR